VSFKRYEFHRSVGGPSTENEDCWAILVAEDSGKMRVEHRWCHRTAYRGGTSSEGQTIYTIGEFTNTTDGKWLRGKLEDALRELGRFL
jgi:hypothetical protein